MAPLRLALAQCDFAVGAVAANAAKMRALIEQARAGHAVLIAFPEMALSGYPPDDLLLRPSFVAACAQELAGLMAVSGEVASVVGYPQLSADGLFNAAAVLRDGRVDAVAHKQALPNYGVFDEKRYFCAGTRSATFRVDDVCIGLLICEDIWQAEPALQAAAAGAHMLLVINASPWDTGKQAEREALLVARARQTGCAIAYVNLVGGQDEVVYDGSSLLVNGDGSIAARAPAFVEGLLWAGFEASTRTFTAERWPQAADTSAEATLYAALVRGTRDYVDKNAAEGVLLGLSGGVDSALTLALAVDALGAARVDAVMLPSRYTSRLSLDGAREQAERLGVNYRVIDIEPTVQALLSALAPSFAGRPADLTEENLQARARE